MNWSKSSKRSRAGQGVHQKHLPRCQRRDKGCLEEKLISEDDARQGEEKIQKLTDQYIKEVEKHLEEKEADLLSM